MKLNLTDEQVIRIIDALNYYACMEAGQTQAPDLLEPGDYGEHKLAADLMRRFKTSRHLRDQWVTNEHGESVRRT